MTSIACRPIGGIDRVLGVSSCQKKVDDIDCIQLDTKVCGPIGGIDIKCLAVRGKSMTSIASDWIPRYVLGSRSCSRNLRRYAVLGLWCCPSQVNDIDCVRLDTKLCSPWRQKLSEASLLCTCIILTGQSPLKELIPE